MSITREIAFRALLIAVAMVLSYVESQFSLAFIAPGVKLGLTNVVVLVALYKLNEKEAIFINLIRILLVGLTFGSLFSIVYSTAGGILSITVMILAKRTDRLNMTFVSILGGISHNIGQIIVASIVVESMAKMYYLPMLIVAGIISGVLVGIVSAQVVKRLPGIK